MVLKLLYLSRIPTGGFFQGAVGYTLSPHMSEEARNDPPTQPGRFAVGPLQPHPPQAVNPEEEELRKRIKHAIAKRHQEHLERQAAGLEPPHKLPSYLSENAAGALECRFNARIDVRLSEVGPGPAAGGPAYFRVDIWAERQAGIFAKEMRYDLFGRVFVPLDDAKLQRRPVTWPAVDAQGNDVAFLTLEFAFVHSPLAVQSLHVTSTTSSEVHLSWGPPAADSAAPLLGYTVEVCTLRRGRRSSSPSGQEPPSAADREGLHWQPIGEVPPNAAPGIAAMNLRGDTSYSFRVRAVNEAGVGEAAYVDSHTGAAAPGACGRLRLAGGTEEALTVEWEAPAETGGVPLVAYRVWVRPFTVSGAADAAAPWEEAARVRHVAGGVQRAEIHIEELNPSISRYLCRVAAVNGAGEMGPPTAEASALPFPNPRALCEPNPQALIPLADWQAHEYMKQFALSSGMSGMQFRSFGLEDPASIANLTYLPPGGKRPVHVPLFQEQMRDGGAEIPIYFAGRRDSLERVDGSHAAYGHAWPPRGGDAYPVAYPMDPSDGWQSHEREPRSSSPSNPSPGCDWGSVARSDAAAAVAAALLRPLHGQEPPPPEPMPPPPQLPGSASACRGFGEQDREPSPPPREAAFYFSGLAEELESPFPRAREAAQAKEDPISVRQKLQEKNVAFQAALNRYKDLSGKLNDAPDDHALLQSQEQAEVEAAGYQAEIAVLTQQLGDLDDRALLVEESAELISASSVARESSVGSGYYRPPPVF